MDARDTETEARWWAAIQGDTLRAAEAEVERLRGEVADMLGEYALFGRDRDGDSTLTGDLAVDMAAYAKRLRTRAEAAEATIERVQAAVRMLAPDDITPNGRRLLDRAIDGNKHEKETR